ncbi:hypothetical protein BKA69DRAFT_1053827 [Paraphysoderma sedebokerense]|nr:hypothetical protein BKA69DRAFT_1053827 [Paraphysoderma sedebokerense]
MSDIRDILGLNAPQSHIKKPKEKEKKPEGIPRELYSLIGSGQSIAVAKPAYKPTLQQKAVRWEFRPFHNSARNDDLMLKHWMKATEREDDYRFVQFNIKPDVIEYTEAEYNASAVDPDWTREETDYLFDLCRQFDLRFIVIADRYEWEQKERSIEDIKDRYYSVTRKILSARYPMGDPNEKAAIASLTFDKAKEIERKRLLAQLLSRTPEQLAEEQALFLEVRKLEEKERTFSRERDAIMKKLYKGVDPAEARRRKAKGEVVEREDVPREKLPAGVHLRSGRLSTQRGLLATKVSNMLTELGVLHAPLMPTFNTITRFEELRSNILTLLDLKKHADKFENEVKVLRHRRDLLEKSKGVKGRDLVANISTSETVNKGKERAQSVGSEDGDVDYTKKRIAVSPAASTPRDSKRPRKN